METEPSEFCDTNSQASESDSASSSMDVTKKQPQQKPMKLRKCTFDECRETVLRGKSGPWMCKYHRNKTYKETYKKKKVKNNPIPGLQPRKGSDCPSPTLGGSDQQDSQQQLSMLGQVLNDKKLALMKSPMVQAFLQEQQNSLCNKRQRTLGLPTHMM